MEKSNTMLCIEDPNLSKGLIILDEGIYDLFIEKKQKLQVDVFAV